MYASITELVSCISVLKKKRNFSPLLLSYPVLLVSSEREANFGAGGKDVTAGVDSKMNWSLAVQTCNAGAAGYFKIDDSRILCHQLLLREWEDILDCNAV